MEASCKWFDTNQEEGQWQDMAAMSTTRYSFSLVTYSDAAFAIGGWGPSSELSTVERWNRNLGWQPMANMPVTNHRYHCTIVPLYRCALVT